MESERRHAPRYPLIAAAEVVALQTDTRFNVRTSDASLAGCYLDMVNPLPGGTEVRLQVKHDGTTFTALGIVTRCEPNMGMGITFTVVGLDQEMILERWLVDLGENRS